VFSLHQVQEAARRALAGGALAPIESRALLLDDAGVRFVVRVVSSLARKPAASPPLADPLGDFDPALFIADLGESHYVLLNKFPVIAGHVLLVTRRFERQERLLSVDDMAAMGTCLDAADGLVFYNGGAEAGSSQPHKHLQCVPLPLAAESGDDVPMERLLHGGASLPFRHAFARVPAAATPPMRYALYRGLLQRAGIAGVAEEEGELQSAPYNLLARRGWMLVVPRAHACFGSVPVNALGFAGSLFVRSQDDLDRVRAAGPMRVLREVTA